MRSSRRQVLSYAAAAVLTAPARAPARAAGFGITLGIQLYSVEMELRQDFEGTLARLAAMGYRDVELTGFFGRKPADLKKALAAAGLVARSAHYSVPTLQYDFDKTLGEAQELGLEQMVCAHPRVPERACPALDVWTWNAGFLDTIGGLVSKAGMKFGYHNHAVEFTRYGTTPGAAKAERTGFDEIVARTDPGRVTLQLDCAWAAAAGVDPAALLARHPGRFLSLHVKDLRRPARDNGAGGIETAAVGQGELNWRTILAAATAAGIARYFVELEPQPGALDALEQSAAYLSAL